MKKVITVLSVFIIVVLLFVGCKEDETVAKFINTEVEGTYTLSELEQMSEEERKSNLENKHIRVRGLVTDAESYKLELDTDKIEVNAYFADENNKDENEDLDECEVVIDGVCTNTYGKYVRIYGVSVIEKNFDEKEKKKQIVRDIEAKNKVEREEYRIREAIEDAFGKKKIENIDIHDGENNKKVVMAYIYAGDYDSLDLLLMNATEAFEEIYTNHSNIGNMIIFISMNLVNNYGETEKVHVIKLQLSDNTASKIIWDDFNFKKLPQIADDAFIHKVLK